MSTPYHADLPSKSTSDSKISLAASSTVYTYHCLCSHLILATTTPLPALPLRQHSIDHAHIMPLPPPPTPATTKPSPLNRQRHSPSSPPTPLDPSHYGLLINTSLQREPEIVTTAGGFEKRYLQRCGRCALVVGYQLDWAQFPEEADKADRFGRKEDVVYLLPGGLMTTRDMVMGKKVDVEISVGAVEVVQQG